MAKYIIEIEDEPVNGLYKAKAFNTLVFDQNGLDRLKRYEEPPKRWRAKRGESYYTLDLCGYVHMRTDQRHEMDEWNYISGNYFQNADEAAFYRHRVIVDYRLMDSKKMRWCR